jgi:hypothetical protein
MLVSVLKVSPFLWSGTVAGLRWQPRGVVVLVYVTVYMPRTAG